jgi:hypothetical protein
VGVEAGEDMMEDMAAGERAVEERAADAKATGFARRATTATMLFARSVIGATVTEQGAEAEYPRAERAGERATGTAVVAAIRITPFGLNAIAARLHGEKLPLWKRRQQLRMAGLHQQLMALLLQLQQVMALLLLQLMALLQQLMVLLLQQLMVLLLQQLMALLLHQLMVLNTMLQLLLPKHMLPKLATDTLQPECTVVILLKRTQAMVNLSHGHKACKGMATAAREAREARGARGAGVAIILVKTARTIGTALAVAILTTHSVPSVIAASRPVLLPRVLLRHRAVLLGGLAIGTALAVAIPTTHSVIVATVAKQPVARSREIPTPLELATGTVRVAGRRIFLFVRNVTNATPLREQLQIRALHLP